MGEMADDYEDAHEAGVDRYHDERGGPLDYAGIGGIDVDDHLIMFPDTGARSIKIIHVPLVEIDEIRTVDGTAEEVAETPAIMWPPPTEGMSRDQLAKLRSIAEQVIAHIDGLGR